MKECDVEKQGSFSVWQDGMKVAGGFGPLEAIRREASHYKLMYSQDGPVKVIVRESKPRKNKSDE
jgi:hypothetical protein